MQEKLNVKEIMLKTDKMEFSEIMDGSATIRAFYSINPPMPMISHSEGKYFLSNEIVAILSDGVIKIKVRKSGVKYIDIEDVNSVLYLGDIKELIQKEVQQKLKDFLGGSK